MYPLKVIWCIFCLVQKLIHHHGPKRKLHLLFHPFLSHLSSPPHPSTPTLFSYAVLSNLRYAGSATFWQELQEQLALSLSWQLNNLFIKDQTWPSHLLLYIKTGQSRTETAATYKRKKKGGILTWLPSFTLSFLRVYTRIYESKERLE